MGEDDLALRVRELDRRRDPAEGRFYATDLELAARLKQLLLDHLVPAYLALEPGPPAPAPPLYRVGMPATHEVRARALVERLAGRMRVRELDDALLFQPAPPPPEVLEQRELAAEPETLEALEAVLSGDVAADRKRAAERLAGLGAPGAATLWRLLAWACTAGGRERGWEAARALSRAQAGTVPPEYARLLCSEKTRLRREAAIYLARTGATDAAAHLGPLLEDPDGEVRAEAEDALWQLARR